MDKLAGCVSLIGFSISASLSWSGGGFVPRDTGPGAAHTRAVAGMLPRAAHMDGTVIGSWACVVWPDRRGRRAWFDGFLASALLRLLFRPAAPGVSGRLRDDIQHPTCRTEGTFCHGTSQSLCRRPLTFGVQRHSPLAPCAIALWRHAPEPP